jgi:hypothetical protein
LVSIFIGAWYDLETNYSRMPSAPIVEDDETEVTTTTWARGGCRVEGSIITVSAGAAAAVTGAAAAMAATTPTTTPKSVCSPFLELATTVCSTRSTPTRHSFYRVRKSCLVYVEFAVKDA